MNLNDLRPLEKLGLHLPAEYELQTAKNYVAIKRSEWEIEMEAAEKKQQEGGAGNKKAKSQPRFNILTTLYEYREMIPTVYKLYVAIETFACSTAICESSFSALSQIDVPSRLSMTNKRMRNLAFLAFEHQRLERLSIDKMLRLFNEEKERKVQLF